MANTQLWSAARGRVDQLETRVRSLGLRETLSIQRDVLRRIGKATMAGTLAWTAVDAIGSPRPALGSLAAIIVVQLTVRASLARSIQFTAAVTLGLVAALSIGAGLGAHWWSVGLIIVISLIAGELLRLGPLSAQVAISALLAMSLGSSYGIERAQDTVIGSLIGVLVSLFIAPPTYVGEAGRTLRTIGDDLSSLLVDMGKGLSRQPTQDTIRRWLARAREIAGNSRSAIATVKQGEESLQYNPRARGEMALLERLTEGRRALDHAISQTRGIARSLLELPQPIDGGDEVQQAMAGLGTMLSEAGTVVGAWGRLMERVKSPDDRQILIDAHDALGRSSAPVTDVLQRLGESPDDQLQSVGRLLTSVLVNVERLIKEVDIVEGAHRAAVEPGDA